MSRLLRKRSNGHLDAEPRPPKQLRVQNIDRLSPLSDELLLRILSFLSADQLLRCQAISQRLHRLASDTQLWKLAYYAHWVRPRATRLPGRPWPGRLDVSSKSVAWINERHLVKPGSSTDWQRQYKLRYNWSRGDAKIRQIHIAEHQPIPRTLVQIHDSIALTAERVQGLRTWRLKHPSKLQSIFDWQDAGNTSAVPLAMAVSSTVEELHPARCLVGFSDGSLSMFAFREDGTELERLSKHRLSDAMSITALALNYPYFASLTSDNTLHVGMYQNTEAAQDGHPRGLHVMSSLRSGSMWLPASLSLRVGSDIDVSVAYTMPQDLYGWSIGLQEVKISKAGSLKRTRIAAAANQPSRDQALSSPDRYSATSVQRDTLGRPVDLSLCHPYILTAHADNTLSLFMVHTKDDKLHIAHPRRLWGHTSSVSAVHVGARGKAVSVGVKGGEIRVWDLERSFSRAPPPHAPEGTSVKVSVLSTEGQPRVGTADYKTAKPGISESRGAPPSNDAWVAFDEEKLFVLQQVTGGSEALMVYDFA